MKQSTAPQSAIPKTLNESTSPRRNSLGCLGPLPREFRWSLEESTGGQGRPENRSDSETLSHPPSRGGKSFLNATWDGNFDLDGYPQIEFSTTGPNHQNDVGGLPDVVWIDPAELSALHNILSEREAESREAIQMGRLLLPRIQGLNACIEMAKHDIECHEAKIEEIHTSFSGVMKGLEAELRAMRHYEYEYRTCEDEIFELETQHRELLLAHETLDAEQKAAHTNHSVEVSENVKAELYGKLSMHRPAQLLAYLRVAFVRWLQWTHTRVIFLLRSYLQDNQAVVARLHEEEREIRSLTFEVHDAIPGKLAPVRTRQLDLHASLKETCTLLAVSSVLGCMRTHFENYKSKPGSTTAPT